MSRKKTEDEWKEFYGTLQEVCDKGEYIIVDIEGLSPLAYSSESQEAEIIKKKLKDVEPGTKIGLMKTDIPEKPIVTRTEESDKFSREGGDNF